MKNLKVHFSMLALVLGIGTAFATVRHQAGTKTWARNPTSGLYTDITAQDPNAHECSDSQNICTAVYEDDVNPNNQAGDAHPGTAQPLSVELGDFSN